MAVHHYVSKFHLREFCDPDSLHTADPWVWYGNLSDGSVKRRAPKNIGTSPDLFDGPGGLAQAEATLEDFLANNIEGSASRALREGTSQSPDLVKSLPWACGPPMGTKAHCQGSLIPNGLPRDFRRSVPPELMRYLAWAGSRALPTQRLEVKWATRFGTLLAAPQVGSPPDGLLDAPDRTRPVPLMHQTLAEITVAADEDLNILLDAGWIPDPRDRSNFLEGVHIQSYYFQARWFPRLRWFTLRPPVGEYFIIGDRPVGWGVPDRLDAPPMLSAGSVGLPHRSTFSEPHPCWPERFESLGSHA